MVVVFLCYAANSQTQMLKHVKNTAKQYSIAELTINNNKTTLWAIKMCHFYFLDDIEKCSLTYS